LHFIQHEFEKATDMKKFVWHPTLADPQQRHDDIWFISPQVGWAVNSAGKIIHTEDGKHWVDQYVAPAQFGIYLRCMSFSGPKDGWVGSITLDHRLRRTQDGVHWDEVPENILPDVPGRVCGISAPSKNVIFASGTQNPWEDAGVMRTTDGGRTWSTLTIPDGVNLLIDTYFTDEKNGWVVGGRGGDAYKKLTPVVLRTTDGGDHWEDRLQGSGIQFPLGEWGWKIQFLNDQLGFVSLENFEAAAILKTTDGGRTWKRIEVTDPQGNMNLEGIGFIDEKLGWVGGWGKEQVNDSTGWSSGTTDGGATWFDANDIGRYINRFRFTGTEPMVGYASGETIYQCVVTDSDAQHATLATAARSFAEAAKSAMPTVTDKLQITADIPAGAKQLNISVWSPRQVLIKMLVDEKNPTPGPRSVTWDFTKPDGYDAGNGVFIYRINIDNTAESKMVHRPWPAAAEDLATRVAQMIKGNATARRSHDLLILPDANGNAVPLKSLFDTPRELMAGLVRGGWVIPGKPKRSMLLQAVIGTDSRPGPMNGRLSAEQVQLLNDWIAAGAAIPANNP
jgi:photosystem II stability/assembly factor-like uncharacterized protein